MKSYNWGILAPGKIATKFATALAYVDGANLYSVASRDQRRAELFAKEFGVQNVAQDYNALIHDSAVDVIYIASPHSFHPDQAIQCLEAGKAVLCEKPMAVNARQAERVIETARANQVFYMEAVWTRFMPVYRAIRAWLDAGEIGDIVSINANFGFNFPFDPASRLYNPDLAGGALLDMGIYPITFAQWVMGDAMPERIQALGQLGASGVDESVAITLKYPQGALATLTTTTLANTDYTAWIIGTRGKIKVPLFWFSHRAELIATERVTDTVVDRFDQQHACNGYEHEILEVQRCLSAGGQQSAAMPWGTSLRLMQIMDEVRAQIGLVYPFENNE